MSILAQNDRWRVLRSNYRLLGLIGKGQFGKVYCGVHRRSGKLVALKSLDRYRLSTQQFLRELRFLLSLRHRNIVGCQSLEHFKRGRYLVMDYCPGGTLRELLEDEQCQVNWQQGLKLIDDVLQGLAHAHDHKIIHCDIKPENILLDPTPEGWVARITDFGIAQVMQDLNIGSGTSGSPAYMAPERFYGRYHLSADLYAVGIILFELLFGKRPFTGTPLELMSAHLSLSPAIPASVPPALGRVLAKSLKKLPPQRFQSAGEMQAALAQAIDEIEDIELRSFQPSPYFRLPDNLSPDQPWPSPLALWSGSTILKTIALPCPVPSERSIVPSSAGFYGAIEQQVFYAPLTPGFPRPASTFAALLESSLSISVPGRIIQILGIAQGCLVMTPQGLYHWNPQAEPDHALTYRYAWEGQKSLSVDPHQRWFAAISVEPNPTLLLGLLSHLNPSVGSAFPLRKLELPPTIDSSFQVLGIDEGHGILLQDRQNQSWIQVFHRRGKILGELSLRLRVKHCILSQKPYRLVGLEPDQPHLVFIDLKPLRIRRIGLPAIPQQITCFSWGYGILAGSSIFFLNQEGQMIGQVKDSIALDFSETQLHAVQDWGVLLLHQNDRQNDRQTVLQIFDLHDLELDLIF